MKNKSKLSAKQLKAIKLMIEDETMSQGEIAKIVGVTETTLSTWKNHNRDFQEGLHSAQWNILSAYSSKAIATMVALLDSKSDYVRFQAADNILTRTGFDPVDKKEVSLNLPTFVDDISDVEE